MMRTLFVFLIVLLSVQIMGVPFAVPTPTQEPEPPEQETLEAEEVTEEGEPSQEGEPEEEAEFVEEESAEESLPQEEAAAEQAETPPVPASPPPPPPQPASNGLIFRFNDVPITTLIDTVMKELGYSYIIDPGVQGTASIHTMGEIPRENAFEILIQLR